MLEDWQAIYAHIKAKFEKAKEVLNVVQQLMEDSNGFIAISSSGVSTIEPTEIKKNSSKLVKINFSRIRLSSM